MEPNKRSRFRIHRTSLRAKITLGVAVPILLVLISLSLAHFWRSRQLLQDQITLAVSQLGEVVMGSLRHTMLTNDSEILTKILDDVGDTESIQEVQIIGIDHQAVASSNSDQVGKIWQLDGQGCTECHEFPAGSRPRTARFSTPASVLRICMPIANDADCATCHEQEGSYLGVLLVDVSTSSIDRQLRYNLEMDLALSIGITLLVTLSVYIAIHRLVVRPVEAFRSPLARFASGNFTSRLPQPQTPTDELGELAHTFNRMAEELEQRAREREEREELRQRAIAEERGRVARELHDGLAQLLGYVTTKAMAVRLMLSKHQLEAADKTLLQLEEAARELLVDVREAISDLKATGQKPAGLAGALQECTAQFSRISGVSVQMSMDLANAELSLPTETELHLLRIVQEALANVYKHASASGVHVTLEAGNGLLKLVLSDDGKGFSQESTRTSQRSHFGLESMRERAQEIGAEFMLDSKPGFGTQITVRLPLEGSS